MSKFWKSLEEPGLCAVPAAWRLTMDGEFDLLRASLFRAREEPATGVPCPRQCGCTHDVVHQTNGPILGVCCCESWNCDDVILTPDDLVEWELSWTKLGRALARALNFESREADLGPRGTRQIGSLGGVPVVLTIQPGRDYFHASVAGLVATLNRPFMLLAPTGGFVDFPSQQLLARCGAEVFPLDTNVTVMPSGIFHARRSAGELFAPHMPEKKKTVQENNAQRIFALLAKLRTEPRKMKAPLHVVFDLTVIDGLSQRETAKRCHCVPSLVTERIKTIEERFGISIEQLRQFASQLVEMQSAVKGDRAARKRDGAVAVDTADEGTPEEYQYEEEADEG